MAPNAERWKMFSPHEQVGAIGAEIMRAKHWQHDDPKGSREKYLSALARALELVDLSLQDERWRGPHLMSLLALRDELAKLYSGQENYDLELLYKAL